jgi:hypothetical protein
VLWWLAATALAARADGFHRLWVDPSTVELHPSTVTGEGAGKLVLSNPFARRADVRVEGVLVGELAPRASATLSDVPIGTWKVAFTMPDGDGRELVVASFASAD